MMRAKIYEELHTVKAFMQTSLWMESARNYIPAIQIHSKHNTELYDRVNDQVKQKNW
jgi:hypothetical protein